MIVSFFQFAFAGLFVLYPHKYGFSTKKEDIETMIYFWSVIGYMLGIDDDYNLFIGDYETIRQRCHRILDQYFRPSLLAYERDSVQMADQIIQSTNQFIPGLRYKSYMKFIWKSLAMDKEWPSKPLNREQQFWYFAKKMIIEKFYYFWAVRFALNQLLRFTLFTMQFSFLQRLKTNQLAHIDQQIQ